MTPAARIAAVIDLLSEAPDGVPAGQVLRRGLQRRRYAGSGDRQAISTLFWSVHRHVARLGWQLEQKGYAPTPRALVLAALPLVDCLSADDVSALFGGDSRHAAEALDDEECALVAAFEGQPVDNDAMPRAVRLEWPEELLADVDAALGPDSDDELAAMQGEAATDIRSHGFWDDFQTFRTGG
jgi:16S rRNA (cytosine967-C5)-methyltransferase